MYFLFFIVKLEGEGKRMVKKKKKKERKEIKMCYSKVYCNKMDEDAPF
jgi:hypothetical protein